MINNQQNQNNYSGKKFVPKRNNSFGQNRPNTVHHTNGGSFSATTHVVNTNTKSFVAENLNKPEALLTNQAKKKLIFVRKNTPHNNPNQNNSQKHHSRPFTEQGACLAWHGRYGQEIGRAHV